MRRFSHTLHRALAVFYTASLTVTAGERLVDNDVVAATVHIYDSTDPENYNWRPMVELAREPGLRDAALVRVGRHYHVQDQEAAIRWFASSGLPQPAWQEVTASK